MRLRIPSRGNMAFALAALAIVAAGGSAVASNMAFRLRLPIVFGGIGQVGNNFFALPFFNPYGTGAGLCSAWGLPSSGTARGLITTFDPVTGFKRGTCGTAGATALTLVPGRCVQVRTPDIPGSPSSVVIVGSHDPSLSITMPAAGTGQLGTYWYAVPYHATAYTVNDLCLQAGMTPLSASCYWITASDGLIHFAACGSPASKSSLAVIQLGQCLMCREPNGPLTFTPQTY